MKLVAITSCPTGIAHSQMAAENLETTAEEMGHEIKVEVQGAMGAPERAHRRGRRRRGRGHHHRRHVRPDRPIR